MGNGYESWVFELLIHSCVQLDLWPVEGGHWFISAVLQEESAFASFGLLIVKDSKEMCQLLFLDNCIMQAQRVLWRLIYYRGDKHVAAARFLWNRSPALIKSDFTSGP